MIALAYIAIAITVFVVVSAWQQAMLASPRYARRRREERECSFCEPPGFFWSRGYSCVSHSKYVLGDEKRYPHSLNPWLAIVMGAAWPALPVAILILTLRDALKRQMAHIVAAQQDSEEAERVLKEIAVEKGK